MIPFDNMTLGAKAAIAAVVVVVAAALGFAYGVTWNADDLANARAGEKTCKATLKGVEDANDELKKKAEERERKFERTFKESGDAWSAVLDWSRKHLVRVRLKPMQASCDTGGLKTDSSAVPGLDVGAGERGSGSGRNEAAEISLEEINDRLNRAREDAARIYALLDERMALQEASK